MKEPKDEDTLTPLGRTPNGDGYVVERHFPSGESRLGVVAKMKDGQPLPENAELVEVNKRCAGPRFQSVVTWYVSPRDREVLRGLGRRLRQEGQLKEGAMNSKLEGENTFLVEFRKPRVEAEPEPILVPKFASGDGSAAFALPSFMGALDLREGDEIEIAWRIASRLEQKRVPVKR